MSLPNPCHMRARQRICIVVLAALAITVLLQSVRLIQLYRHRSNLVESSFLLSATPDTGCQLSFVEFAARGSFHLSYPDASRRVSHVPEGIRDSILSLAELKTIETIWWDAAPFDTGEMEFWGPKEWHSVLKACPRLRRLSLSGCFVGDETVSSLPGLCPELEELRIGQFEVSSDHHRVPDGRAVQFATPDCLTSVDKMRKLRILDCRDVRLSKSSVEALSKCKCLKYLNVGGCGLDRQDVERLLSGISSLRLMILCEYRWATRYSSTSDLPVIWPDNGPPSEMDGLRERFPAVKIVERPEWLSAYLREGKIPCRNDWHILER